MNESIRVFSARSSDGIDTRKVCDGISHYEWMLPDWEENEEEHLEIARTSACDGSCRATNLKVSLTKIVEELRGEKLSTEQGGLHNRLQISEQAQALLAQESIMGHQIDSWYVKRNGHGSTYCLQNGQHLVVDVRYDWWSGDNTGFYQTVTIKIEPCNKDRWPHRFEPPNIIERIRRSLPTNA